jgi:outer membrane receptor protein involved in Fe transport
MSIKGLLRIALLAIVAMLVQGTWVLAGTTGSISGTVTDQNGAPIAGVRVTATSPSQNASVTSDAKGFYSVLNLSPDTYTITAAKTGYDPSTLYGVTVTADQNAAGDIKIHSTTAVLGHVTATAQAGAVSKTVTGDLYAVNAAKINSYQGSAGGAETLYSQNGVVGSLPGVVRAIGGGGTYNGQGTLSLRGGAYDQVGFELEGIPLNRGFDFYNGTALATNGLASVEVYTGGAPADSGRAMSGFINGTIQRGRYPGGADFTGTVGSPSFAHALQVAIYGASPDGRFSYYVSALSNNQGYNWGDKNNQDNHILNVPANDLGCTNWAPLNGYQTTQPLNPNYWNCASAHNLNVPMGESVFVNNTLPFNQARDTTANLHWTFQHGGLSDDLQALLVNGTTGGPFPYSGGRSDPTFFNFEIGQGNVGPNLLWPTGISYSGALGAAYDPSKIGNLTWPTSGGANGNDPTKPGSFIPATFLDSQTTQYSIEKLGYTRSLTDTSFVRLFAYSLYSAWSIDEPTEGLNGATFYQLHDNATGVSLNYQNQVNRQNLVKFDVDYSKDLTLRYNYGNFFTQQRFRGAVSEPGGFVVCGNNNANIFDPLNTNGDAWTASNCGLAGYTVKQIKGPYAYWSSTTPITSDAVLADNFKPSDKWNFDVGVRYDQFKFALMPLQINGANGLAEQAQNQDGMCLHGYNYAPAEVCNGYLTQLATGAGMAQFAPGATKWSDVSGDLVFNEFSPRFGATYAASPVDVFRASVGRYVQPPNSAFEEYRAGPQWGPGDTISILNRFYDGLGFHALHNVQPEDSTNYDLSYEHDFSGGLSLKLTPYARSTRGQVLNLPVNPAQPSFVTGYNFGTARIHGAEFLVQKIRTSDTGLSATLAATYTDSKIKFGPAASGKSVIDLVNGAITAYNATIGQPGGPPAGTKVQPLEDPNAYYSPSFGQVGPTGNSYDVKWVMNLNLDERFKGGWDLMPAFTYQSGNPYGDPFNFGAVPDPYTHQFDAFGSLKGPSWVTMNLGVGHDISSRTKATLLFTNVFTAVHNQGYPWEYGTGNQVIGYGGSPFYSLNSGIGPAYNGQTYYPYVPTNVSPLHQILFTVSTKL